jgi:hypothetical protein
LYASEQTMGGAVDILAECPPACGSTRNRSGSSVLAPANRQRRTKEQVMSLGTILLIILILMLLGILPTWPHARSWGYGPSGIVGVVLVVVLVLFLMGRL